MISVEGLTVEFGGFTLFDDVSFVVNKKDRIALVGKNGAGKSKYLPACSLLPPGRSAYRRRRRSVIFPSR